MRRSDPRIRQTLNQISQNLESANIATQASLFSLSQTYISPCLNSLHTCLEASCHPCFTARDEQRKPRRSARRGRDDLAFDFYDDWEEDEGDWGNDELDRLLAGSDGQPSRQRGMSYGSRIARRRSMGMPRDGNSDPTVVPSSSMFGFLERLPWRIGGRGHRYRPSAADLQENVGRGRGEGEPLIEEIEDDGQHPSQARYGRNRSGTANSATTNSLSSRGDLIPSESEEDAIPLDDEFAIEFDRITGTLSDDQSSGNKGAIRPLGSRASTRTASSKDTRFSAPPRRGTSTSTGTKPNVVEDGEDNVPSITDLKQEEDNLRKEEEAELDKKRHAAQRLALQRGLSSPISSSPVCPGPD